MEAFKNKFATVVIHLLLLHSVVVDATQNKQVNLFGLLLVLVTYTVHSAGSNTQLAQRADNVFCNDIPLPVTCDLVAWPSLPSIKHFMWKPRLSGRLTVFLFICLSVGISY